MNTWPMFDPQNSASDLADHPHCVQLIDGQSGLAFPTLCPNCGDVASRKITVQKVFRQVDGSHLIQGEEIPYCDRCITQHECELQALTCLQRVLVSLASGEIISAVGLGCMALMILPRALQDLVHPNFPWLFCGVLITLSIVYILLTGIWEQNAYRRVPPQTSITRAFDFSESYAQLFDEKRRTYSIRNATFAEAFMALNYNKTWDPDSPTSICTSHFRKYLMSAIIVMVFVMILWEVANFILGR